MNPNKKILVIGASTGIGEKLTNALLSNGNKVWAVARRIEGSQTSRVDISNFSDVMKLAIDLKVANFTPDVVVINAGIYQNDIADNVNVQICESMLKTNFMGAIHCVHALKSLVPASAQFIAISSSSALKGSSFEGAGYAASKAALTVAFESFHMKWSKTGPLFTTIFFGPLDTSLRRTKGGSVFLTSAESAVQLIIKAMVQRKPIYHQPKSLFFLLRLLKVLPPSLYLRLLTFIERRLNKA